MGETQNHLAFERQRARGPKCPGSSAANMTETLASWGVRRRPVGPRLNVACHL